VFRDVVEADATRDAEKRAGQRREDLRY
jgi:hypothetical protein